MAEADRLRVSLILLMTNRIETYTHLQSCVISADLPPHFYCETIYNRLRLAAKNDACVGIILRVKAGQPRRCHGLGSRGLQWLEVSEAVAN
ncbi:hypothetical protein RRG08_007527 [Elysia crispata]|uniref:Uncharacterized protein n=1 Tax=Elysia crispata TaxID=231223 RepID=A0AAE1DZG7_9GAST|nr:hypothetical protein RRG08_007527 [Elysia crispata]